MLPIYFHGNNLRNSKENNAYGYDTFTSTKQFSFPLSIFARDEQELVCHPNENQDQKKQSTFFIAVMTTSLSGKYLFRYYELTKALDIF